MNMRRWGLLLYAAGTAILVVGPIVVRMADLHPGHAIPIAAVVVCLVGVLMTHQRPQTTTPVEEPGESRPRSDPPI